MIQEREGRTVPGYPALFALLVVSAGLVVAIVLGLIDIEHLGSAGTLGILVLVVLLALGYAGLTAVNPTKRGPWCCSATMTGASSGRASGGSTRSRGAHACR